MKQEDKTEEVEIGILPESWHWKEGDDDPVQDLCWKCKEEGRETPVTLNGYVHRVIDEMKHGRTVCQDCIDAYELRKRRNEMKASWEALTPSEYRNTKLNHPTFNTTAHRECQKYSLDTSLFLFGESGTCKTRAMLWRAKLAILKGYSVGILFPDEMKEHAREKYRLDTLKKLALFDWLGLDDLFSCGTNDYMADWIKDLIDRRMRQGKTTVITSQIVEFEWTDEAKKFKNYTNVEMKRIDAIWRRIRERFTPINFDTPQLGSEQTKVLPF